MENEKIKNKKNKEKKEINYRKIIIVVLILVIIIAILYFTISKNNKQNNLENNNANNDSMSTELNSGEAVGKIEEERKIGEGEDNAGYIGEEDKKLYDLTNEAKDEVNDILKEDVVKNVENKASNDEEKLE